MKQVECTCLFTVFLECDFKNSEVNEAISILHSFKHLVHFSLLRPGQLTFENFPIVPTCTVYFC